MKTINYLGIDVSKKTLQIDTAQGALSRANQAKTLKVWLQQLPAHSHLVLEASGGDYFLETYGAVFSNFKTLPPLLSTTARAKLWSIIL